MQGSQWKYGLNVTPAIISFDNVQGNNGTWFIFATSDDFLASL